MSHSTPTPGQPLNRLADSTSPYLLQHAANPVDWYPWGEEAFARAAELDRPIFLSIGYAACHWCHVMAHESFENDVIAAILNEHFVSIKVDREELPDVDDLYMTVVQMLTGHGGWPMSVFLTPELKPFYGGTYFPPLDRQGMPGFGRLLQTLTRLWSEDRARVLDSAEQITGHLRAQHGGKADADGGETGEAAEGTSAPANPSLDAAGGGTSTAAESDDDATAAGPGLPSGMHLAHAAEALRDSFDRKWGGFGGAPKFPPSAAIALLLRQTRATGEMALLEMASHTLLAMGNGGIYDHLGGGFSRYSVDDHWLVPHFEKMLYDNALLADVYLQAYSATGDERFATTARETITYVLRDLRDTAGGFHSSEDADSEGEEGKFYVWTEAEIDALLDPEAARMLKAVYGVTAAGNFEGHSILNRRETNVVAAARLGLDAMPPAEFEARLAVARARLLLARDSRIRPGLDDKVLTAWNGLMLTALARGSALLGVAEWRTAAEQAADFLLTTMRPDGELLRAYRQGTAHLPAYLEDYAFLAAGLLDLYEASFEPRWLRAARELADRLLQLFWDEAEGCLYFTSAAHQHLIVRPRPSYDGATPSGNSIATQVLLRLARLYDEARYTAVAERLLAAARPDLEQAPRAYMNMLHAVDFHAAEPLEIALIGDPADAAFQELAGVLGRSFLPNRVLAAWNPADPAQADLGALPMFTGKTLVDGAAAAYVCRRYVCAAPVTTPAALAEALGLS